MGNCKSSKKFCSHSHPNNHLKKNDVKFRKQSSSTKLPNGISKINGEDFLKRKSVKLSEIDRISKETILDGK